MYRLFLLSTLLEVIAQAMMIRMMTTTVIMTTEQLLIGRAH
jgi:hypothetical protein